MPSLGRIRIERFVRKHVPVTPQTFATPAEIDAYLAGSDYDCLICGSDQVWLIYDHQGVDAPYFLGVGPETGLRRVSYAPSAGPMQSFGAFRDEVAPLLARFDALSVRDSNTGAAVADLGIGAEVTRVVDPTLIADFSPLVSGTPRRDEIVVVGKTNAAADDYIRFAAQSLGCKVRAVGTRSEAADLQRPFASPIEWLGHVGHARLVITSLFHGAAVSMALRTPFVALDCGGRAFKLEDLCGYLGVPERLLLTQDTGGYAQDPALLGMSYAALDGRLRDEARASTAFLEEAILG